MKRWLPVLVLAALLPVRAWSRDSVITNLTVSPASAPNGSIVTVSFDIAAGSGGGGDTTRFAVGLTDAGYTYSCNTTNQVNWVADDLGIYDSAAGYTVDGVTTAEPERVITDVVGPTNGLVGGTGTTARHIVMAIKVPPEFSGNYQVMVLGNRDGGSLTSGTCTGCQFGATSIAYTGLVATGAPLVKLNLEVCNAGSTSSEIRWQWRVTNWGESGVRLTGLGLKYCFFDNATSYDAQSSSNAHAYLPGGGGYCNTYNPSSQYSFNAFATVDCGADGKANHCYNYTLGNGPISQSMPYYDPPGGGYMQSEAPSIWFRITGSPTWDSSDDYANLTLAPTCGSGWSSLPKVALYNNNQVVCEWESSGNNDPNSGVPYCGSTSGCNTCPPGTIPNQAKNSTGPSNVVCLSVYSPTPTPVMQLTKTADKPTASLGDTITYTISWANNASAARVMTLWDTVPPNLTYAGCSTPAGSCSQSGGIVTWSLGSQAAGSSGSVTFWAVVSSLPYNPFWPASRERLALLAPESRRLNRSLWDPWGPRAE